ncbi:MAG: hypothetical protein U5J97_03390 [Trueperaceae bacterium]|nr:hypothetical protein [Trueperaceae bacterium]
MIDTDGDGLTDLEEVLGFQYEGLAGVEVEVRPDASGPATNPLSRDSDEDGLDDRSEIRLGTDPTTPDGATVFDDDGDGLVNVEETTPRTITVHDASPAVIAGDHDADGSQRTTASDPDVVDTDGDGLTDWEEYHGCRDLDRDLACDPDVPAFGPTGSTRRRGHAERRRYRSRRPERPGRGRRRLVHDAYGRHRTALPRPGRRRHGRRRALRRG